MNEKGRPTDEQAQKVPGGTGDPSLVFTALTLATHSDSVHELVGLPEDYMSGRDREFIKNVFTKKGLDIEEYVDLYPYGSFEGP